VAENTNKVLITIDREKLPILKQRADALGLPLSRYLVMAGLTFKIKNIEERGNE